MRGPEESWPRRSYRDAVVPTNLRTQTLEHAEPHLVLCLGSGQLPILPEALEVIYRQSDNRAVSRCRSQQAILYQRYLAIDLRSIYRSLLVEIDYPTASFR